MVVQSFIERELIIQIYQDILPKLAGETGALPYDY
jgi:hypothetical protein